jgi:RimJ/RimL family protein N-acetyltransferase
MTRESRSARAAGTRRLLSGPRLYLREVLPADAGGRYLSWMNDPEVTRYLESRFFPTTAGSLRAYVEARLGDSDHLFLAIVLARGDRHIGNIKVGPIDRVHRHADVGILIGESDCWGQGYATEAIRLVVDHAFGALSLHRLTASCYAGNEASAAAFEKAGFVREGVRRDHYRSGGRYVDAVMLGIVRQAARSAARTAHRGRSRRPRPRTQAGSRSWPGRVPVR